MSAPIRLAVIGAGWIADHGYAPHLAKSTRFSVTAVCDPRIDRAAALAARIGGRATSAFDAALADADAVLLTHPSAHHVADAIRALRQGRAVLCEKPIAARRADIAALAAAAKGTCFRAARVCRHRRDVAAWHAALGRIGTLERLDLRWRRRQGVPAAAGWAMAPAGGLTGVFADLGHHLADLALAALGDRGDAPVALTACTPQGGSVAPASWYGAGAGDAVPGVEVAMQCSFACDGVPIAIDVAWSGNDGGDRTLLVAQGSAGTATLDGLFGFSPDRATPDQRVTVRTASALETQDFPPGPAGHIAAFAGVLAEFADAIAGGAPCDWGEATRLAGMLEDVERAASPAGRGSPGP